MAWLQILIKGSFVAVTICFCGFMGKWTQFVINIPTTIMEPQTFSNVPCWQLRSAASLSLHLTQTLPSASNNLTYIRESNAPSNLMRTPILKAIFGWKMWALDSRKYGISRLIGPGHLFTVYRGPVSNLASPKETLSPVSWRKQESSSGSSIFISNRS